MYGCFLSDGDATHSSVVDDGRIAGIVNRSNIAGFDVCCHLHPVQFHSDPVFVLRDDAARHIYPHLAFDVYRPCAGRDLVRTRIRACS